MSIISGKSLVVVIVVAYLVVTTGIGLASARRNKNATQLMTAKNTLGPFIVGFLLMSEFLGTGGLIGTPQKAFTQGMFASMAMISLSIAFIAYAFIVAPKYRDSGHYTISGVLQERYGTGVRYLGSILLIFGLMIDTVSNYTGGAVALEEVLGINVKLTSLILAVIVILLVGGGGLHGMGISNLIHICVKYIALIILAIVAWKLLATNGAARARIPAEFYTPEGTGVSQLFSWTIANVGAVFATQYVMQSISALRSRREAVRAGVIAGILMFPVGILGAFIGVAARGLFPTIDSARAIPVFFGELSPVTGGVVVAGIVAAAVISLSALVIGASTLVMRDFYSIIARNRSQEKLVPVRVIASILCLIPLPVVWFVPDILGVVFLSRALRAAIGVLIVLVFYLPAVVRERSAIIGLSMSLVGTITWYALGNPFGVDNTYLAIGLPLVFMLADGAVSRRRGLRAGGGYERGV